MYCGEASLVKGDAQNKVAITVRCRSWNCETCRPGRKRRLIAEAIGGHPNRFLTLTSRRKKDQTPDDAAKALSHAWRIIRLRLMRRFPGKPIAFLAVVERHLSGWPHLHILIRGPFLSQKLLSAWMAELVDGPIVWIEAIDSVGRVATYVQKYIGKDPHRFARTKRYWQSRDYDLRPEPEPKDKHIPGCGWERDTWNLQRIARSWVALQWIVSWHGQDKITAEVTRPWEWEP